jgi:uncharacterized iron-regulated membrane protein
MNNEKTKNAVFDLANRSDSRNIPRSGIVAEWPDDRRHAALKHYDTKHERRAKRKAHRLLGTVAAGLVMLGGTIDGKNSTVYSEFVNSGAQAKGVSWDQFQANWQAHNHGADPGDVRFGEKNNVPEYNK